MRLDPASSLSLVVGVVFFFKLTVLNASYVAFVTFLLFVYVGLLLLWEGFTLSFLIIAIIYSTIFIIFWIFFISFSDAQEKREHQTPGTWLLWVCSAAAVLSGFWFQPVYQLGSSYARPTLEPLDGMGSQLEFLVLFKLLYQGHALLLICFFTALLLACFSVVSLLTFKTMAQSESSRALSLRA